MFKHHNCSLLNQSLKKRIINHNTSIRIEKDTEEKASDLSRDIAAPIKTSSSYILPVNPISSAIIDKQQHSSSNNSNSNSNNQGTETTGEKNTLNKLYKYEDNAIIQAEINPT